MLPGWKNDKHGQQWINTLTTYVFPTLGSKALQDIQPNDIAEVLKPIWLTKAETASRVKQRMHAVMTWGWAHGHCTSNPVDVVTYLLPQQPGKAVRTQHHPAMPWRDVPDFVINKLRSNNQFDVTRLLLEFVILTACRSGEARGMTWDEVDFDKAVWVIPAHRMKGKVAHRIPLSQRVIEILKHQKENPLLDDTQEVLLVFPSIRDQVMLSDMTLTELLRRNQSAQRHSGANCHSARFPFQLQRLVQ